MTSSTDDPHGPGDESYLFATNAGFLEELYRRYDANPEQVDSAWRQRFDSLNGRGDTVVDSGTKSAPHAGAATATTWTAEAAQKQSSVLRLINAYRMRGHQVARLDPLELTEAPEVPDLDLAFNRLDEHDLDTVFDTGSLAAAKRLTLRQIIDVADYVYCGSVGSEYMHITDTREKRWVQAHLERIPARPRYPDTQRRQILNRLTMAEGLERYLHTKYVGQKRFSLEGADCVIPMLYDLIQRAGSMGTKEIVIGMAHRGRLNVLVNTLGKAPGDLFGEFEGKYSTSNGSIDSGDVKYHQGFSSDIATPGGTVHLALSFNPSHLEIIDPVVEGSVRARQHRRKDYTHDTVMPILVHGDAAFAGQGVVMETLNMSQARGFANGGTLHIIINNQIGFTTSNPLDARSTVYCTEVAKMVQAPIFHVNGDDPDAVIFVTRLAQDFRMEFKKDVVIDLVCYRRHGHNEADEPSVTQPIMYKKIKAHPTTRQLYAQKLVAEGVISSNADERMQTEYRDALDNGHIVAGQVIDPEKGKFMVDWSPYLNVAWTHSADTSIPVDRLRKMAERLHEVPSDFKLHPRINKIRDDRVKMAAGELPLDWGFAETMAYATLIEDGYSVRLSGQDCGRGTFFHRHAILHNQTDHRVYIPLKSIRDADAFTVINSLLSEEAVLGFEYGYATTDPMTLAVWEAQFGDFANGAQVVIDQFISSGEAKWGRLCGLTLLLPHGYEGQGPEHSSARLERYLQLCAEHNMQVCVPTTPAQIFHLLRRQMVRPLRRPLVIMSPKSLLRHKLATSQLEELANAQFEPVLDESNSKLDAQE
ncbi:MAG: 2-oxoglutarate dehydrogenase E1 component, partial [Gammaproteobacteria bacterium]|nr:2-oxoglutarate dehydrogenase E1 component [Gammaproteobacteria bacterium]